MKVNKWVCGGLGVFCLLLVIYGCTLFVPRWTDCQACDFRFRHNEICCSHEGINPFKIWNHEVDSVHFKGLSRPDYTFDSASEKLAVHAYPPWHTTFFWFYGWLPQEVGIVLMYLLFGGALCFLPFFLSRWQPHEVSCRLFFWGVLLVPLTYPIITCIATGNYGLFLFLLSVWLYWSLEKKHDILAGIAWALLMIKPQVGLLFIWPLLFQKRYLTIVVAGLICSLATLWPAYIYKCSPIELLLQIPQIGEPYMVATYGSLPGIARILLGSVGAPIWMIICFIACGILSFLIRNAPTWWLRTLPVILIFPVWTYSQAHDLIISWSLYLLVTLVCIGGAPFVVPRQGRIYFLVYTGILAIITAFNLTWEIVTQMNWFNPAGKGFIFVGVNMLLTGLTFVMFLMALRWIRASSPQKEVTSK
ncbi:MAG: glycosyltransferase family 87 protein [Kiritimatiellia bacterium]